MRLGVSHHPLIDSVNEPGTYTKRLATMSECLDGLDNAPTPLAVDDRVIAALSPKMLDLGSVDVCGSGQRRATRHDGQEGTMTDIRTRDSQDEVLGPAEYFTGRATIRGQFARDEPSRVTGAIVTFAPGARTAWHSHPLGQTLVVLDGVGWTQVDGEAVQQFAAGDILLCPADRRHWHGATPDAAMTHVAIQEALEGTNVTWMEPVTDGQYFAGRDVT